MEEHKNISDLINQRNALKGAEIMRLVRHLGFSLSILIGNYQDLATACLIYENDVHIWDENNRQELDWLISEITRLLHNYLASVTSLIDHTRVFCRRLGCSKFQETYEEKLNEVKSNACLHFMKQLRNYAHHYHVPFVDARFSFQRGENQEGDIFEQTLHLEKNMLLKWDDWSSKSRQYIDGHEDDLDLKATIDEYQVLIVEFYKWIASTIEQLYNEELNELNQIEERIQKKWESMDFSDLGPENKQ